MIYDLQGWYDRERLLYNYTTVTEGIVYCMRSLAVDEAKLRAETDAQGRLTNIQGTLVLQLTDDREQEHSLDISFRFNAGSYGESKVEIFDPEAYNVVPWPRE